MGSVFWTTILPVVAGIIATVLVSRYYFRRTLAVRHELTPYIKSFSTPLKRISEQLRAELEVRYRDNKITELCEVQFLIANTGEKTLRDIIEPLTLKIPENCALLDVQILHVSPEGRLVEVESRPTDIIFRIALLNPSEFFVAKVLMNGTVQWSDLKFTITADDLLPILSPVPLPYGAIAPTEEQKRAWGLAIITFFGLGLSLTLFIGIIAAWVPVKWEGIGTVWPLIKADGFRVLGLALVGALGLMAGMVMIAALTPGATFPRPRNRFIVPDALLPKRHGPRPYFVDDF